VLIWWFLSTRIGINSLLSLAISALYVTTPAAANAVLFRSAKSGAACMSIICMFRLHQYVNQEKPQNLVHVGPEANGGHWRVLWRRDFFKPLAAIFFLCMAALLFDEQPLFMLLAVAGWSGWLWIWRRQAKFFHIAATLGLTAVCGIAYSLLAMRVMPQLIYGARVSNYAFYLGCLKRDYFMFDVINQSWYLLMDCVGYIFGNFGTWLGFVFFLLCCAGHYWPPREPHDDGTASEARPFAPGTLFVFFLSLWALIAIMYICHPSIADPDVSLVYYWLPILALLNIVLPWMIAPWLKRMCASTTGLLSALAIVIAIAVANVHGLREHKAVFYAGDRKSVV
jgi:hypothetical protein